MKRGEHRASARGRAASPNTTADPARSRSDTRISKPTWTDLLNTPLDHPLHRRSLHEVLLKCVLQDILSSSPAP